MEPTIFTSKRRGREVNPGEISRGQTLWVLDQESGRRKKRMGLGPNQFVTESEYLNMKNEKRFSSDFKPDPGLGSRDTRNNHGFVGRSLLA